MATIEKRTDRNGQVTYRVKVRLKGAKPQTATFRRITDAKRWAQSTEAAIREGRHFKTAEAKRHNLAEVVDRYKRDVLPHKKCKTPNALQQLVTWFATGLGGANCFFAAL